MIIPSTEECESTPPVARPAGAATRLRFRVRLGGAAHPLVFL